MNPWPKDRNDEFRAMRAAGMSVQDIAREAHVSEQVASYHLIDVEPISKYIDLLPNYQSETLKIPDGSCALTSDWHGPYISMKWVNRLLRACLVLDVRTLAIVGDFMDLAWLARYTRKETRGSLADDFKIIMLVLKMLLDFYDDVYWIYGNHEERLINALSGKGDMLFEVMDAIAKPCHGKLHTSDQRGMMLGDAWQLEHPKTFSKDAAKVAAQAASILLKNVACGHGHHLGFKYDVSGKFIGIDLGGMFDEARQEYLYKSGLTTLPNFNPGFWIYRDGVMSPFGDGLQNWSTWRTR